MTTLDPPFPGPDGLLIGGRCPVETETGMPLSGREVAGTETPLVEVRVTGQTVVETAMTEVWTENREAGQSLMPGPQLVMVISLVV